MTSFLYDAAIIGGGPAGSCAAFVLAHEGRRVAILERERFPRFHIGESLLPRTMGLYRRLELDRVLTSEGFIPKYGAQIVSNDGSCEMCLDFRTDPPNPDIVAWEVEREVFDKLLLEHARSRGAEIRQGTTVLDVEAAQDRPCRLRVRDAEGLESTLEARWVIDASGQGSLLAKIHGLRVKHPTYNRVAVYAWYKGMSRRDGYKAGNVDLVLGPGGWFWLIPLRNDITSVGFVAPTARWKESRLSPEEFLESAISRSPFVLARMKPGARREGPVYVASDYSYASRRLVGPGFVLAGDAAEFLDPIWSTGVMLAMRGGEKAGRALARVLKSGRSPRLEDFLDYERAFRRWTRVHFETIDAFYAPGFAEVLFNRRNTLGIQDAVTRLLAGQSDLSVLDRIRVRLFYGLIRLNKKYRFLKDPRPPEHAVSHA